MRFSKILFSQKEWIDKISLFLLSLVVFGFPLENRYDKPLRRISLSLIPEGVALPVGFEKKIYFYLTDIVALILFLFLIFAFKIPLKRLFTQQGAMYLWAFFLMALLSIYFSPLSNYPVIYSRLIQLLTPIFLYSFVTQVSLSEKTITFLLSLLILTTLLQSLFAIIQYFTQEPLGLRIFNESRDVPACFEIVNGYRWTFDRITGHGGSSSFVKRAIGTLNHSNLLGGLIALACLLFYSFLTHAKKLWVKRAMAVGLFFLFFALSITYSRSAIFGLILGTFFWFAFTFLKQGLKEHKFLMKAIFFSGLLCSFLLFEQFQYRGGLLNYNKTVKSSDQIRIHAQSAAIQMIKEHPLLGVGYSQFANASIHYLPPGEETPLAHNIFLLIAAETGILSLLTFLSFIASLLFQVLQLPFSTTMASLLSIFGLFLFIGCCDFYPLVIQEGKIMLFITAALMIAEAKNLKQKIPEIHPCRT